jgi:hypothetical protein
LWTASPSAEYKIAALHIQKTNKIPSSNNKLTQDFHCTLGNFQKTSSNPTTLTQPFPATHCGHLGTSEYTC